MTSNDGGCLVRRFFGLGLIGLALVATGACDHHSGPNKLTADVRASQWVRDTTPIEGYKVEAGNAADQTIKLTLLDTAGLVLGTTTVWLHQDDGSVKAELSMDGKPKLTLLSRGTGKVDGYVNAMQLTDDRGRHVKIRADHRIDSCYAPPHGPAVAEPACAAPIPITEDAYSLPYCGPIRFNLADVGLATPLRTLTYIKDEPDAYPTDGDQAWLGGQATQARITVYGNGDLADETQLSSWLAATGADAIIGSPGEKFLTAVLQDPNWRNHVQGVWGGQLNPVKQVAIAPSASPAAACSLNALQLYGAVAPDALRAQLCGSSWLSALVAGANGHGDPHFTTFDHVQFDFQGAGEYVLVKSSSDDLELQGRFEPRPADPSVGPACEGVSWFQAVAMRLDGTRVEIHGGGDLVVNGTPVADTAALAAALPAEVGFETERAAVSPGGMGTYTFTLKDGTRIAVTNGSSLLVQVFPAASRKGSLEGLFGGYNDSKAETFQLPDGSILGMPLSRQQLYGQFGEQWRVADASKSLFSYKPGEGPGTFYIANFPSTPGRIVDLPDAVRTAAEAQCADVVGEPQHSWCVLDSACAGESQAQVYTDMPVGGGAWIRPAVRPVAVSGALVNQDQAPTQAGATDSCRIPGLIQNRIFAEQFGYPLTGNVTIDAASPGDYDSSAQLSPATIAAGTKVDVWFVDIPQADREVPVFAEMRFVGDILGVVATPANLDASDTVGDPSKMTYPTGDGKRGFLRTVDNANQFTITNDRRGLQLKLGAPGGEPAQLRVFVAAP